MALLVGKANIYGLTGATAAIPALTGYVSPNMQTLRVSDTQPDHKEIKSQAGEVEGKIFVQDDIIELTIDFIPQAGTIANARKSAGLPVKGSRVEISGLPVIVLGAFADALNATTNQPWFYEGGGTINGVNDDKWTMTLPLRRYKGITADTAIT